MVGLMVRLYCQRCEGNKVLCSDCAELLKCGKIDKKESDVLFVITNNISPVFISSYILCQQLQMPSLIILSYLSLYQPPLMHAEVLLQK